MSAKKLKIQDAVSSLGLKDHACLFFANPRRWHDFVVAFFCRGLERLERCVYITALHSPEHMRHLLAGAHDSLRNALDKGQLLVTHFSQSYTPKGVFEPEATVEGLEKTVEQALARGYRGLRITGEMHWASYRPPGYTRLAHYEALLNPLLENQPCLAVCQYDRALFAPNVLDEIAGLHHFMVEA